MHELIKKFYEIGSDHEFSDTEVSKVWRSNEEFMHALHEVNRIRSGFGVIIYPVVRDRKPMCTVNTGISSKLTSRECKTAWDVSKAMRVTQKKAEEFMKSAKEKFADELPLNAEHEGIREMAEQYILDVREEFATTPFHYYFTYALWVLWCVCVQEFQETANTYSDKHRSGTDRGNNDKDCTKLFVSPDELGKFVLNLYEKLGPWGDSVGYFPLTADSMSAIDTTVREIRSF